MKTVLKEINFNGLPKCWILVNRRYWYHPEASWEEYFSLPTVTKEYEFILKQLNLPHRDSQNYFNLGKVEFWNPEIFEEEKKNLPLYAEVGKNKYRYLKNHSGDIVTAKTIKAARKIDNMVRDAILKYELEKDKEKRFYRLKNMLKGKKVVTSNVLNIKKEVDFIYGNEHIKVLPVMTKVYDDILGYEEDVYTYLNVVLDVNKIELDSVLDIKVSPGYRGKYIGKNGWQVKAWCKKLGLRRINVVEI